MSPRLPETMERGLEMTAGLVSAADRIEAVRRAFANGGERFALAEAIAGIGLVVLLAIVAGLVVRQRDERRRGGASGRRLAAALGLDRADWRLADDLARRAERPSAHALLVSAGCFDDALASARRYGASTPRRERRWADLRDRLFPDEAA